MHSDPPPLPLALATIAELGVALTGVSSLQQLMQTLKSHLTWLLPSAHLILSVQTDMEVRCLTPLYDRVCMMASDPCVAWCLEHETSFGIADTTDASCLPSQLALFRPDYRSCQIIFLPLSDAMKGAILIGSNSPGAYQQIDSGIINLLGQQIAAALRVALLLEEVDHAEAIMTGLARALDARDAYTAGHSDRVTRYAVQLADAAGLPFAIRARIMRSGPLHDIGKIGVSDDILRKPGRLDDEEFAQIALHPIKGVEICQPLRSLQRLIDGIKHHHEQYNGRGYPDGLAGEAIPLEARVLAIADTYDAMTSDRPYRRGMPHARAIGIISANEGEQWDPKLVRVFVEEVDWSDRIESDKRAA